MLLRTLIPAAAAAILVAAPAHAAPVSVTYTTVGESVYIVPPGVHRVDVALTGAGGGSLFNGPGGGRGATVTGSLPVSPGDRLYAQVGGAGTDFIGGSSALSNPGGANGGGAGFNGGGGASDIRTKPASASGTLNTRLAVAGGGGGDGYGVAGGDAGAPGSGGPTGGLPGTLTAGGAGGIASNGHDGTAGSLGVGGDGMAPSSRGGGGGGGLYGGGGGAGEGACRSCGDLGGGGGGSSLVPAGGTSGLAAAGQAAQVTISYASPQVATSATRLDLPTTQPGALSASRTFELTNPTNTTDLNVTGVSVDSDEFLVGRNCFGAIAPGAKCTIGVRFAPSAAGSHTAKLRVHTDAGPVEIALSGESVAPAQPLGSAAPAAVKPSTTRPALKSARVTCKGKRCSVKFLAGIPKVAANHTRVRATLTKGGRVYASADRVSRRGALRLVLNARRALKPGTYTLKLQIGAQRTTRTAIVTS